MAKYIVVQTAWYQIDADSTDQALEIAQTKEDEMRLLDMDWSVEEARYNV